MKTTMEKEGIFRFKFPKISNSLLELSKFLEILPI